MAGYMPNLVACRDCACYESDRMSFLFDSGELLCGDCMSKAAKQPVKALTLPKGVLAAMRHIIYSPFERLFAFELSTEGLQYLGDVIEKYLIYQTEKNYITLDFYKSLL